MRHSTANTKRAACTPAARWGASNWSLAWRGARGGDAAAGAAAPRGAAFCCGARPRAVRSVLAVLLVGGRVHEGADLPLVAELDLHHPAAAIGLAVDLRATGGGRRGQASEQEGGVLAAWPGALPENAGRAEGGCTAHHHVPAGVTRSSAGGTDDAAAHIPDHAPHRPGVKEATSHSVHARAATSTHTHTHTHTNKHTHTNTLTHTHRGQHRHIRVPAHARAHADTHNHEGHRARQPAAPPHLGGLPDELLVDGHHFAAQGRVHVAGRLGGEEQATRRRWVRAGRRPGMERLGVLVPYPAEWTQSARAARAPLKKGVAA